MAIRILWVCTNITENVRNGKRDHLLSHVFSRYILSRPCLLGIDPIKNKDNMRAFNHFWRVVGHFIGLKPQFNLCSANVKESQFRARQMVSQLIKPAFFSHSNTYVKVVKDFVDVYWYFNPFISMDSLFLLSNRLVIPGYYLTSQQQRHHDLETTDHHQNLKWRKLKSESYSPKSITYVRNLGFKGKVIIATVRHIFERYSKSKVYKLFLNNLVWFGRFCQRQLSFMVVGLGFRNSYSKYWAMREAIRYKKCPWVDGKKTDE